MADATGLALVEALLDFAAEVMAGVEPARRLSRLRSIMAGTNRLPPTPVERALLAASEGGAASLHVALKAIESDAGTWVFRDDLLDAMFATLKAVARGTHIDPSVAAREVVRARGGERKLPHRAVGSTLLLKGLEAERAVVFDTGTMHACHLYVALTRASHQLTIVAPEPVLTPVKRGR